MNKDRDCKPEPTTGREAPSAERRGLDEAATLDAWEEWVDSLECQDCLAEFPYESDVYFSALELCRLAFQAGVKASQSHEERAPGERALASGSGNGEDSRL